MTTVADHLTVLRRLLHDAADVYWPEADKIAYISQAMQQRDLVSGANRTLITHTLTAGDDTYTFSDLSNTRIFDVVGLNIIYTGLRIVLDQMSFSELNATWRVYSSTYRDRPMAWCRYGASSVIMAPSPAQAYSAEFDCCITGPVVTLTSESDPLLYPWTEPVPYYAACLAKLNERQYDEADDFEERFIEKVNAATSQRAGMVPSMYPRQ